MKINLADFKTYRDLKTNRKVKAVYVTDENAKQLGEKSGLWAMFGKAMCFGIMALARTDQWVIIDVNQRTGKPRRIYFASQSIFKNNFKLIKN